MQQYRIPFVGLKTGKHEFEFDIDKDFFDAFEYSIVKDGSLKAHVLLDKQESILQLSFHIYGSIALTCDVCLADFMGKIEIREQLIVRFGDEEMGESTEEIMVLPRNEHELKLADTIYEYINLSVPHYAKCDIQGEGISCDSNMIEKLRSLSSEKEESEQTKTDPRWDILKNIKNN
ncbi:YceD family protein [Olivibacter sitiensis]|uniref:YceD family protein n=1 Tax=Olivibacter sitiensis TaxID=376470 RepID=UPI000402176F|nr:DUF177 domain-containing protein [Olivibacter sitiensis]